MARPPRRVTERVRAEALLLRRVPYGEADLIVTLFVDGLGVIAAAARSARRSSKRFASLEPLHGLVVTLDRREGVDVATLVDADLARPRLGVARSLERLEAAGHALRWVREGSPPLVPEPEVWEELHALLDRLDAEVLPRSPAVELAAAGLRLLRAFGWGLDLRRCVRCGRDAGTAAAAVDPGLGGLVCRACGGARQVLSGPQRQRIAAAAEGDEESLTDADAAPAVELVEATLAAFASR